MIMTVIAVIGIRPTAHTQVVLAAVEYAILIGFSVAGLVAVLSGRPGTVPVTSGWFSASGIGGHGSLTAGLLTGSSRRDHRGRPRPGRGPRPPEYAPPRRRPRSRGAA